MNAFHVFLSFFQGDEKLVCNHYFKDFGMMDVQTSFGGTKFEQAQNVEDSYKFKLVCVALE